jgi:hypothetical protein
VRCHSVTPTSGLRVPNSYIRSARALEISEVVLKSITVETMGGETTICPLPQTQQRNSSSVAEAKPDCDASHRAKDPEGTRASMHKDESQHRLDEQHHHAVMRHDRWPGTTQDKIFFLEISTCLAIEILILACNWQHFSDDSETT